MSDSYRIANWDEYQHYKHRNPPWVRLYYDLLSSETWVAESDATRCLMIACILVASRRGGEVPDNPKYLMKVAHLNSKPDLKPLILNGFLLASNALADCGHDASILHPALYSGINLSLSEKERDLSQGREGGVASAPLAERFERWWSVVTKKVGKKNARAQFDRLNPDGALLDLMVSRAAAYYASNEVKFLKDPERWLSGRRWEDESGSPPATAANPEKRYKSDLEKEMEFQANEKRLWDEAVARGDELPQ